MSTIRKIQCTPNGTFFVTLPKSWAIQRGLKRGSVVSTCQTTDGKLLIDPEYGFEPSPRSTTLKVGPFLSREIIGYYLLGSDIIRIESKKHVDSKMRDTVKGTVDRLIGLEIVEEDQSSIVLQCLLKPSVFPPEKILKRAYAIISGMHRDVLNALTDGNVQLARSIIVRDNDGNRLYFLLVRILRTIVQNPGLSERLGVTPIDCLDYRLVASLVEAIGDECVRIAMKASELKGAKLAGNLQTLLSEFNSLCYAAHEIALNAFLIGNVELAEEVRSKREKTEKTLAEIEKATKAQSLKVVTPILAVAALLKQIYEHSVDIADLVVPRKQ